ncbi:NAD-dependent epimerase/dehydratase family protein [Bdellovibrio sp. HCB337]|uniref:NAD-dependent epimerase/dehydratase family protein n=1 Tax=Bdellovibrio sp. HCB337 TaxID=3394358 RepID=UPI0039A76C2B
MKILVLGGTRYFGKRLVHSLIAKNHDVTVLTRGNTKDDFGSKVKHLEADRTQLESMKKALGDKTFDVVVDNICMTAKDVEISLELFSGKIKHYVMTSTVSVYHFGANLKEGDFNPLTYQAVAPTNPAEVYAEGKRAAENVFAAKAPFKWAFARIPVVVGEDDYTERLLKQVQSIKTGKPLYYPNLDAKFSFIRSEDAANALLWIIENHKEGIYNFASEEPMVLRSLVHLIEKVVDKKVSLSDKASQEYWSPYGIPADWYVNVSKAFGEGYRAPQVMEWMPGLIKVLAEK